MSKNVTYFVPVPGEFGIDNEIVVITVTGVYELLAKVDGIKAATGLNIQYFSSHAAAEEYLKYFNEGYNLVS